MKRQSKSVELLDIVFLCLMGVYILCRCIYNSTFVLPAYTFPGRTCFTFILYVCAAAALLRVLLIGGWLKNLLPASAMVIAYFLAYRTGRELVLLMIPILSGGAMGMDYRKILKVYVIAVGSFLAVTVLCALTGVISNIVHYRNGHLRSSMGIAYSTDFASQILFFALILWLSWERIPDEAAIALPLLSFGIAYYITESRTSELGSILFFFFVLLFIIHRRAMQKKRSVQQNTGGLEKGFRILLVLSFILFAAAFFVALVVFSKGGEAGLKLDRLLSNRLVQTMEVYRDQGIHPFGSSYSPIGRGGSAISPDTIYFIDSSYPLILIRYGWVLFATVTGLWTWMGLRVNKAGNIKLLCAMTVVTFHALSEHHFLDLQYNILLILPFAAFADADGEAAEGNKQSNTVHWRLPEIVSGILILGILILAGPRVLSRLRTAFYIWGVSSPWAELRAIGWVILILLAVCGLAAGVWKLGKKILNHKKPQGRAFILPVLCTVVLCVILCVDSSVIRAAGKGFSEAVQVEKAALEIITGSAKGAVFAEDAPELYRNLFPAIGRPFWHGDDLARYSDASVIVSTAEDRQRFTDMGFLFTEISPAHGVYSNDPAVIEAMTAAEYAWTDYDAVVRNIDLQLMADLNHLELTRDGTVLLQNGEALRSGPFIDLFQGEYEVEFCLRNASVSAGDDNPVCTLRICDYYGETVYAEETVERDAFHDGDGQWVALSFSTGSSRSLRFQVVPSDGEKLELTGLRYRKTGSLY